MKKILALTLICLFSLQNITNAEVISNESSNKITNVSKIESFVGEYKLLNFDVKISLNKDNKLILTLPLVDDSIERTYQVIKLQSTLYKGKSLEIFPVHGDFELIQINDLNFIIKFSGGYSIEFTKNNLEISKNIILRDSNFDIFNENSYQEMVSMYKELISTYQSYFEKIEKSSKPLDEKSSLESNMHSIQTELETHAVDWGGLYPDKSEELEKEAKLKSYWKEIKNPFTQMLGVGKNGAIMDYKIYKNYKPHPSLKGLVLYESIDSKFDKLEKKSFCVKYNIYGTDEKGELLKDKEGKVFILTNF
jgi:hypothetical protein